MRDTISFKMYTTTELKEVLRKFITDSTFTPSSQVKDDTLIFVQGIFDSMGFISLINFLEEEFSIRAEDSELLEENFESINAISNFIQRKIQ